MRKRKLITERRHVIHILALMLIIATGGLSGFDNKPEQVENNYTYAYLDKVKEIKELASQYQYQVMTEVSKRPDYDINLDVTYQDLIWELCEKNRLSYELVLAVLYHESGGFNLKAVNVNKDNSRDSGIGQINSRYINAYKNYAIQYSDLEEGIQFDVMNTDHNIRAAIGGLCYWKDYWRNLGVDDEDSLFYFTLNSYNMGGSNYQKYVKNTGNLTRYYDQKIFELKEKLETTHTL